ncbi:hypothetical protein JCM10908_002399 [Rhodotorula pacifica]|uniref:TBP-associated factor 8 family protein n=1 Tax=Rhodotorula pacifica TaxID=1495444 RepID=UPI00316B3716
MDSVFGTPATTSDNEDEDLLLEEEEEEEEDDASSSASSSLPAATADRPDLPGSIPALVLHRAIAAGLTNAGFEEAEPAALDELEGALASFFGSLLLYAHDLAEHARRHVPTLADVLTGCEHLGIGGAQELLHEAEVARVRAVAAADGGQETPLRLRYQRPRAALDPGSLLPSDDEADQDPFDPSNDPSRASPPPSPPQLAMSDSEEDDFEEVTPLGPDGLPLPSAEHESMQKQRREAAERRRRERQEKRDRLEAERELRRAERERRRRERQRRREADPLKAEWLPALPPKHSWKQTPVYPESAAPPPIPPPISQTQQAPSAAALRHLSTLRARLNDSQLVASSLRNLIRRTRASGLGASAGDVGGGVGMGEHDSADVVDYESEWYGGARGLNSATGAAAGKRKIRIVTVGQKSNNRPGDLLDMELDSRKGGGGGLGGMDGEGSRVGGGAVKRRRWLV